MAVQRTLRIALIALGAVGLAACAGGPAPSATPSEPSTSQTHTAETDSAEPSAPATSPPATRSGQGDEGGAGCAPTAVAVPQGSAIGPTADLDGDGRTDELWLADDADGTRMLGVRTATGAVFSEAFTSAAPQAASAIGQRLGDGSAIVLLDTGRAVLLYAVIDCRLQATANADGGQYTFDRGFTGNGTGVGCEDHGAGLELIGYLAQVDGDTATVTSTRIELSGGGAEAANGLESEHAELPADDALVGAATSVGCGDAAPPVHEPED